MSKQWVGSADLSVRGEPKVHTNPVQELTQEIDRKTFGHLQDRVRALEHALQYVDWIDSGFCPHCHADELRSSNDEYDDEQHLSVTVYRCGACGAMWAGDIGEWISLAKQLAAMKQRAETAEAKLAAVPKEALKRTLLTGYRTDAQITADADAINAWLGGGEAASEQDAGLLVDTLGGMCPTQAEGTMGGNPFYFRARHGSWELRVVKPGCDPVWPDNKEDLLLNWSGDDPSNGWMEEPDVMAVLQRASELLASARV